MNLAERITQIKPSPTLSLDAKIKALKAEGADVIGFGAGEPDFHTPDHIKQAGIQAIEDNFTRYTPVGGIPELKEAVAAKFKRDNDLDYSPDEIAVRFHHRLVSVHPFPNGNGRHARLMTDLLLANVFGCPRFTWGSENLSKAGEARRRYIASLHAADEGDYGPLREFARI